MRKVSVEAAVAFFNSKERKFSNTEVRVYWDGTVKLYLFDNLIAERYMDKLIITNAGWNTVTTKDRLNALLEVYELNEYIAIHKGEHYIRTVKDGVTTSSVPFTSKNYKLENW
jgi:hypothetical protein